MAHPRLAIYLVAAMPVSAKKYKQVRYNKAALAFIEAGAMILRILAIKRWRLRSQVLRITNCYPAIMPSLAYPLLGSMTSIATHKR